MPQPDSLLFGQQVLISVAYRTGSTSTPAVDCEYCFDARIVYVDVGVPDWTGCRRHPIACPHCQTKG